jgi:hypothetical protein
MRKGFLLSALMMPLLVAGTIRAGDKDLEGIDPICCESPSSNWYVGFELPVLKPHMGTLGADLGIFNHPPVDVTPSHDYQASPRIYLGWDNAEGLGVRARYWTFDSDATLAFPQDGNHNFFGPISGTQSWLGADTFDFEATQRGCLGHLQFQLAGGFRYANMETGVGIYSDVVAPTQQMAGIDMDFEGVGPTVAIDIRRPFGNRGLALVGSARSSWMYGETDITGAGILDQLPVGVYADDHLMQINELSLGIEWSRCLARGGKVSVAALWESQAWEWAPVAGLIHQDIGLTGPTFTVSYIR